MAKQGFRHGVHPTEMIVREGIIKAAHAKGAWSTWCAFTVSIYSVVCLLYLACLCVARVLKGFVILSLAGVMGRCDGM